MMLGVRISALRLCFIELKSEAVLVDLWEFVKSLARFWELSVGIVNLIWCVWSDRFVKKKEARTPNLNR